MPADVGIVAALAIEVADLVDASRAFASISRPSIPVIEGEHAGKIVAVAVGGPGQKGGPALRPRS